MRNRAVILAASVFVVAVVAGITLGIMTLLGVTFAGGSQTTESASSGDDRSRLSICVQAVGLSSPLEAAEAEATAKSRIEAVIPQVTTHPLWELAGYAASEQVIDIGCPSLPPEPRVPEALFPIETIVGRKVQEPSPYADFVFILPEGQLKPLISTSASPTIRRASQERMCEGVHVCWTVTEAVYLSPEELEDPNFLALVIEVALGLGKRP